MSFLTDLIGGVAKQASTRIQKEEEANNEELRWQKRLEFQKTLEEQLAASRPVSTVYENGKIILLNAKGEPVGERDATAGERQAQELAAREAEVKMRNLSPEKIAEQEAIDKEKRELDKSSTLSQNRLRDAQTGYYGVLGQAALSGGGGKGGSNPTSWTEDSDASEAEGAVTALLEQAYASPDTKRVAVQASESMREAMKLPAGRERNAALMRVRAYLEANIEPSKQTPVAPLGSK